MTPTTTISIWAAIKNTTYAAVFMVSLDFLGITPISVEMLAVLIFVDVVCGVVKAATIGGWQSIKSSVLERGVIAKVLIVMAPVSLAVAGKGVGIPLGMLAQSAINVLLFSEAYSIVGNIYAIKTGKEKVEFDAIAYVLNGLKNLLKRVIVEDTPQDIEP